MKYKGIVGLETHVELKTRQKMFCSCRAHYFGETPNTNVCPVCLGLPGALPVPNEEAIKWTLLLGLALNCKINLESFFERKHYFYPDLPKGYQISQYLKPFCYDGYLIIEDKKIRINRVHLEEDTGKLLHGQQFGDTDASYIDFNRSGVPLVEIVTEPDIETGEEAALYLKALQQIIRYLDISDCDMEKGSMRCEPNISIVSKEVWNRNRKLPEYKVEVKNINSFRFVKRAIDYEFERQTLLFEKKEIPVQETRRYLESAAKTETMRSKEFAHDYRYFPEPDIPPIHLTQKYLAPLKTKLKSTELPLGREEKLRLKYKLPQKYVQVLTEDKSLGDKFYEIVKTDARLDAEKVAGFLVNKKIPHSLSVEETVKTIQKSLTKKTLDISLVTETVKTIISQNAKAVTDFKQGKTSSLQYLLGQVLRKLGKGVEVDIIRLELEKQLTAK